MFDKVVSVVVLEHSPNPLNFIKEQFRILKLKGIIEVVTDNAQYYRWSVMDRFGARHEDYHKDHHMIFYPKNVMRLMKLAGFENIRFSYIRNHRKLDRILKIFIRLKILRDDCLFYRFRVVGYKSK